LKDFAAHAEAMTRRLKEASEALARRAGRPILYVRSATALKEAIAREDGIETGLICILTAPAFAGAGYRTVLVVPDPARPGRKAAVP
jgi:hypothetical protein